VEYDHEITICLGSSCFARGNKQVVELVKKFVAEYGLNAKVFLHGGLCGGLCEDGPIVKIDENIYKGVTSETVMQCLSEYFQVNQ